MAGGEAPGESGCREGNVDSGREEQKHGRQEDESATERDEEQIFEVEGEGELHAAGARGCAIGNCESRQAFRGRDLGSKGGRREVVEAMAGAYVCAKGVKVRDG